MSVNQENDIFFIFSLAALYAFSCLIVLVGISSTVLNRSNENEHFCLVLDFWGKAFILSLLSVMLVAEFSKMLPFSG